MNARKKDTVYAEMPAADAPAPQQLHAGYGTVFEVAVKRAMEKMDTDLEEEARGEVDRVLNTFTMHGYLMYHYSEIEASNDEAYQRGLYDGKAKPPRKTTGKVVAKKRK